MKEHLDAARVNPNNEFYTRYEDIARELDYFLEKGYFEGKDILLPCDTDKSNFVKYFKDKKSKAKFNSITYTHWDETLTFEENISKNNMMYEWHHFGDFDLVITNPPFSKFRDFVDRLMKGSYYTGEPVNFIIIGHGLGATYKNISEYYAEGKIWNGHNRINDFIGPNNELKKVNGRWFTNIKNECFNRKLPENKFNKTLEEVKENLITFNDKEYGENIVLVNKLKYFPIDYESKMAVPATFLDFINYNEYRVLGSLKPITDEKQYFTKILIEKIT